MQLLAVLGWLVFGVLLSTFVEYWSHRAMHSGWLIPRKHARHHQQRWGQGAFWEFRDYILPTLPICWWGFLFSVEGGIGILLADLLYCSFAGYAHQLQHERPQQVFWMRQPVHAVHHYHNEWKTNFGITTDLWDRVFGTHRPHPALPLMGDLERGRFDVHVFTAAEPMPRKPRNALAGLDDLAGNA